MEQTQSSANKSGMKKDQFSVNYKTEDYSDMDGKISSSMYESISKISGVQEVYPDVKGKEKVYAGKKIRS